MIRAYRIFSAFIYGLVYWYGRWRANKGDLLWRDRLALATYNTPVDVWLHAASVGEVRVVNCLISYLREQRPDLTLHLTVMTRTGYHTARTLFKSEVDVAYLPLDVPLLMKRKIKSVRPKVLVIAETEIWPNLIQAAADASIPVVMVNGRMSEKAYGKYRLFESSFRRLLSQYHQLFVKSKADGDRIVGFLDEPERLVVAGDMKFDAPMHDRSPEKRSEVRRSIGMAPDQFLWVAGSTREGEEPLLLDLYCSLAKKFPQLRLLIAPRHLERVAEIEVDIRSHGLTVRRLGEGTPPIRQSEIVLIDRMGLLNDLYSAADLAFVGGTFGTVGGHNILEPIWAGTPVLFGPSTSNVTDAAQYIAEHGYGAKTDTVTDLERMVADVLGGEVHFAVKSDEVDAKSATSMCGSYLITRHLDG
ncbi:MAG: glycosyltransferase N-terminal domain-containing protein [Candidatus Zixiibacteriota bacterium]